MKGTHVFLILLLDILAIYNTKFDVNPSGQAGTQIPHPPLGDDSSPYGR
jgi:hypothetical protein